MNYFEPVITWLREQNDKTKETLGWPDFDWVPPVPEGYPEDIGKTAQRSLPTLYTKGLYMRSEERPVKNAF